MTTESNPNSTSLKDQKNLTDELNQALCLSKVRVIRWRGNFSVESRVEIKDRVYTPDDHVKPGHVCVIAPELNKKLTNIESRIRNAIWPVIRISVYRPFVAMDGTKKLNRTQVDDDGVVSLKYVDKIRTKITTLIEKEWNPAVDELVYSYDRMVEDFKRTYPEIYVEIEDKLPHKDYLRNLCYVDYTERKFGYDYDHMKLVQESVVRESINGLKESIAKIRNTIVKEKGVLNKVSIENAVSAIELFKSVSSLMPVSGVLPLVNQVEDILRTNSAKDFNDKVGGAAKEISALISQINSTVDASTMVDLINAKQRKIAV